MVSYPQSSIAQTQRTTSVQQAEEVVQETYERGYQVQRNPDDSQSSKEAQKEANKERQKRLTTQYLNHDGKPGILVSKRNPRDIQADAMRVLESLDDKLFIRGGQIVRIEVDEKKLPHIRVVDKRKLSAILTENANFVKHGWDGEPSPVHPPEQIVENILAEGQWSFPPLEGIVETPQLRPDGTILKEPGYDTATRLYYIPAEGLVIPEIPDNPTPEELNAAVEFYAEPFIDILFEDQASRANAIALKLTTLIRKAIDGCVPMAGIDATSPGSAKSLVTEVVSLESTGRNAPMMDQLKSDDEWRKNITSTLKDGASLVVIDNVKGVLSSPVLDKTLTARMCDDRLLGTNEKVQFPQEAIFIATGNNLSFGGDMIRRFYPIRIDTKMPDPENRPTSEFKYPKLKQWVKENRGKLVASGLTIARAWYAAGKPAPQNKVPVMGSFEEWSEIVGGILAHAGIEGFLGNLKELREQSTDGVTDQWGAFIQALEDFFGDKIFMVSDILEVVKEVDKFNANPTEAEKAFREAIPDGILNRKDGNPNRILGNGLQRFKGKIFDEDGRHLVYVGKHPRSKSAQWKIARREVVQPEASPQITQIMQVSDTTQEFFSSTATLPQPASERGTNQEKKVSQGYTDLHNLYNLHGEPTRSPVGGEGQGQPGDDFDPFVDDDMPPRKPLLEDDFDPYLDDAVSPSHSPSLRSSRVGRKGRSKKNDFDPFVDDDLF